MSSSPKITTNLQTYRLLMYRKALHPEFFEIQDRRGVQYGDYDFETWIGPGAHMMRFECGGQCCVELVTPTDDEMPENGLITSVPCAGERDHEEQFEDQFVYITTVQTESITDNLYKSTLIEMQEHVDQNDSLWYRWREPDCRFDSLSLIDWQRFRHEVHAQTWHLDATCGLIVRSQAIFDTSNVPEMDEDQ